MSKKQKLAMTVQRVFQILAQHPRGLSSNELWDALTFSHDSLNGTGNGNGALSSFENFTFSCVGPIKAGWLSAERNYWTLTAEGKKAFEKYTDAQQLLAEAGKRSSQGWLAVHFPATYTAAGKTKDQLLSELRTMRRVGFSRLLKESLGKQTDWQEQLPVQSPRNVILPAPSAANMSLIDYVRGTGASYREGAHAVYLSPQSLKHTSFQASVENYPSDAGLKIVKKPGGLDQSGYILGRAKGDSKIQLGMVHGHRHLSLVANFLYAMGIGPRLYDLVNLQFCEQLWTAYVIQDVGDNAPTVAQCEAGVQKLRELHDQGVIKVILPEGFDDPEFECPACGNNALVDGEGQFKYIDFQNFLLGDYESFLTRLATDAGEQTHFGDTALLRGGRYLYQSVPGVSLPAKRDVANRMKTLGRLFNEANVSVADRVVLDVGCNIGMMMAQYLKLGARWCHGWDRAFTIPHTERMLLALGCTRFSTTAGDITRSQTMMTDVPAHVARSLDGCAISYLAIRGHVNWLDALRDIPWSFMIYEGHEGETLKDFESYLAELKTLTNFELGPVGTYVDGDSEERTVAILLRKP